MVVSPIPDATHGLGCAKAVANVSPLYVVIENEHYGLTIKDSWGVTEPVQVWIPGSGDVYYARTAAATGIAAGEEVIIDEDNPGMVVAAATAGTGIGIAYGAIETVSFTNDAGTPTTFYFVPVQVK
jgi:hypothetical protein